MVQDEILNIFKKKNAYLEGHFELASKKHSSQYMQCAQILQYPELTHELCVQLGSKVNHYKIDAVVGPAIGGIVIAYEMARVLRCRAFYAERKEEALELRRGFEINPGERLLLVEDVITTGGSIIELARLCEQSGAKIMGFASLVDRSEGKIDFPYPLISLLQITLPSYDREHCHLCQKGIPISKPGSQKLMKREK